jgi:nucleoside-diphosphate-sugar epimerase
VIAILGATGYVGRSLARLLADEGRPLTLFARDLGKLANHGWPSAVELRELGEFDAAGFDLVVNAIGAGDPARVKSIGSDILGITAFWDQRVMTTMGARTRYVFLSSGAVYGSSFDRPVDADSRLCLPVNAMESVPAYTTAKLQAELSHRAARERAILDLRIFGYADPAIDLDGTFFLAELARAVRSGGVFLTSPDDMVRDYAGALELRALIDRWEQAGAPNCPLDLYTAAPASKHDILKACTARYGLRMEYLAASGSTATGERRFYASQYRAAEDFGFKPERAAIQVLTDTIDAIIAQGSGRRPSRSAGPSER